MTHALTAHAAMPTLISQAQAATILGLTPAATRYLAVHRRLLTRRKKGWKVLYVLGEVLALARQRAGQPKRGRVSDVERLRRQGVHVPKVVRISEELGECHRLEAART